MHHSGMHPIFINGGWVPAQGPPRDVKNPATLEVLDTVPECGVAEVERAVDAARAAQSRMVQGAGSASGTHRSSRSALGSGRASLTWQPC